MQIGRFIPALKYLVNGRSVFARNPEEARIAAAEIEKLIQASKNMLKMNPQGNILLTAEAFLQEVPKKLDILHKN